MDQLGCRYQRGRVGLFVWAKIPDHWADAYALSDHLLDEARVFITPGGIFGSRGERYLRISLCSDQATLRQARERIARLGAETLSGHPAKQQS